MVHRPTRILLKMSGEFMRSCPEDTFSHEALCRVAEACAELHASGMEFGIVVGAGNLYRGRDAHEELRDRVTGDKIGMLGTVMNALALQDGLLRCGVRCHVMAPDAVSGLVSAVDQRKARALIGAKEPVIFAGGLGVPFISTDSAAVIRALEIQATLLVKATKVAGVYSQDPVLYPEAVRFSVLRYQQALESDVRFMDRAALALAQEHGLSMFVYKFGCPPSIAEALCTDGVGTYLEP